MAKTKQSDSRSRATRRADLLAAAQRAMSVHGTQVRLNQVAEQAGLSSGAVLYHFPDLQDLLIEANRAGMERFYDERLRAIQGIADPAERLFVTILSGLPTGKDDDEVRLLCALGGEAARNPVYAVLLTALFDRQVTMYQQILQDGVRAGAFVLNSDSLAIARNLVALEDAYGYRIMAGHPVLDPVASAGLILDYARMATGHTLAFASHSRYRQMLEVR
ncbi:MAG: TetR/AcrR family transcriptional regulator [Actinomycetales bacterium]